MGTKTDFDIHVGTPGGATPELHTRRDSTLDNNILTSLLELQDQQVCVLDEEQNLYRSYVEKNLSDILAVDALNTQEKTEVMYECAQLVMEGLLGLTEAPNLIPRARSIAIALSDFAFATDDFLKHFIKVFNYKYSIATHSVNVMLYSLCVVKRLGIRDVGWIQNFSLGSLLLDLGKSNIDKKILKQEVPLNKAQWKIVKMHPVWTADILKSHGIIDEVVLNIARHHHEKLNGVGYPEGWKAAKIPKYVRIVTICDIFDALTTKRVYNDATDTFSALKLMHEKMIGEIDGDVFKVFVQMMSSTKE